MSGRTRLMLLGVALVAALGIVAGAVMASAPTTVEIVIRHSRFEPSQIRVPLDRPVTIVIRNDDPIDHEWIVGDAAVHERHRTGTEPVHDARPTEISIPALETRSTTITFSSAGRQAFICHLPGHEAYGMVGVATILR